MIKLSDKLLSLRKKNGLSQEELAEKLNVSRQSVSRWEVGSAQPDAANILQLSRLFGVTADYLLNDDYESDNDIPKIIKMKEDNTQQVLFFLVTLEIMVLILQFMCVFILQNNALGMFSFLPFIALLGGFECAYRKKENEKSERAKQFRKKFYKISAWMGWYFPIRLLINTCSVLYTRPFSALVLEGIIAAVYIAVALLTNLMIEKTYRLHCSKELS